MVEEDAAVGSVPFTYPPDIGEDPRFWINLEWDIQSLEMCCQRLRDCIAIKDLEMFNTVCRTIDRLSDAMSLGSWAWFEAEVQCGVVEDDPVARNHMRQQVIIQVAEREGADEPYGDDRGYA